MRPIREVAKMIQNKLYVTAGPALYDRVLTGIRHADGQSKKTTAAPTEPRLRRMMAWFKSR